MSDMAEETSHSSEKSAAGERPTPRPGDHPPALSRHTPSALALGERQRADFWKVIALAVCLGAMTLSWLTIRAGRATELIHVMDTAGNVTTGPVEPLANSRGFFNTTAIYATNAAMQRSPAGFDLRELLPLYFTPRAVQKLEDDLKKQADDIRRRNLQIKPLIDVIGDPVAAGSNRIVEVKGRLVVAGAYAGRSFYDEPDYRLVFTFERNPDLGKAGAYPWVCSDVEIKVTKEARR
jgi:hypothetical protein